MSHCLVVAHLKSPEGVYIVVNVGILATLRHVATKVATNVATMVKNSANFARVKFAPVEETKVIRIEKNI